jgi:hypothetical protein
MGGVLGSISDRQIHRLAEDTGRFAVVQDVVIATISAEVTMQVALVRFFFAPYNDRESSWT